ncbi:hypothetical protein FDECE_6585 [Fusarium decemcellulare]|nr:hypothetical protein FDECE_6585 [Fusarium decemcellulare]
MVIKLTSDGLTGLCSEEKSLLLDTVDSLRSHGISHYISLPQIIVCGDQSSGKSSVLEAISGVSFPVRSNVCTRFPTELVLRKTDETAVHVSIVPHHSRSKSEKATLRGFQEKLETFDELPDLIERAKAAMGITTLGKAFSNDLLRIEVSGPDRPHLTIVDLPGLIHSETKTQSKDDVKMIKQVVQGYMKESRSVILAVVSAKNDYANQVVLKLAQKADPEGIRTLGVITKPDTLHPGSESERDYINLAHNKDVEFRLGWHVLRNRDSEKDSWDPDERNSQEKDFFSKGSWASLNSSDWGIDLLRGRLSKLLLRQISMELPNLITEIETKSVLRQGQLDKLGQPRATVDQQRTYLIRIGQSFQGIVKTAVEGNYTDSFFGDAKSATGYEKRIRAVIQNRAIDFADSLGKKGKLLRIYDDDDDDEEEEEDDWPPDLSLSKNEYLAKIDALMRRSRGRELPGMFNPMIVADLFREQSSPWGAIALAYVKGVWEAARDFLRRVVKHVADSTTVSTLLEFIIMPKLDQILKGLNEKAKGLLNQHQEGHPITYNHYFTDTLQKIRMERQKSEISRKICTYFQVDSLSMRSGLNINLKALVNHLAGSVESDMNKFAALEVLDFLEAYYKVAMKRFIDDVAVEVIEAGLVAELGKIIDPVSVSIMSTDELNKIAGETDASRAFRKDLQRELTVLKDGMNICKQFARFGLVELDEKDGVGGKVPYGLDESDSIPSAAEEDLSDLDERPDAEDAPPKAPFLAETPLEFDVPYSSVDDLIKKFSVDRKELADDEVPKAPAYDEVPAPPYNRPLSKKDKKKKKKREKERAAMLRPNGISY